MRISRSDRGARPVIGAEAAAWFVELRAGKPDSVTRAGFLDWLRRSPEHIQAYLEVCCAWAELPTQDPGHRIDVRALLARARADTDVTELAPGLAQLSRKAETGSRNPPLRRGLRFGIAASILLSILATVWVLLVPRAETYMTGIGEQRTVRLADRSVVELNTRSQLRVRLARGRRQMDLAEGEALFRVATDPARPFVVQAGAAEIRALGTEFDVYRKPDATVVTILEGRVSVRMTSASLASSATPLEIAAGEQLTVTAKSMSGPRAVDTLAATAWIHRQLRFEETPLSEVVAELNRYNTRPLVVQGEELKRLKISGLYSSTDQTSLISFLRAQPSIMVADTGTEIRISKR